MIFLWETITVDCAIFMLPLHSICKGKGKGRAKGKRRKEKGERERGKEKGTGERERREEEGERGHYFSLGNHNCGLRHL